MNTRGNYRAWEELQFGLALAYKGPSLRAAGEAGYRIRARAPAPCQSYTLPHSEGRRLSRLSPRSQDLHRFKLYSLCPGLVPQARKVYHPWHPATHHPGLNRVRSGQGHLSSLVTASIELHPIGYAEPNSQRLAYALASQSRLPFLSLAE